MAERVDALDLLGDLGDQLDPLAQRLVEARRDPAPEHWRAAAQAAREAGYDYLEYGCCLQALAGDEPSTFRLPVVERLLTDNLRPPRHAARRRSPITWTGRPSFYNQPTKI